VQKMTENPKFYGLFLKDLHILINDVKKRTVVNS